MITGKETIPHRVSVLRALVDQLSRVQLSHLNGINVVPYLLPVKGSWCKRVHCQPHLVMINENLRHNVKKKSVHGNYRDTYLAPLGVPPLTLEEMLAFLQGTTILLGLLQKL